MSNDDTGLMFVIDSKEYPGPSIDSLTMGERRVLYDLSGIVQEDFSRLEDETEDEHGARLRQLMRHPGFMEALMHIAFQRGNPGMKRDKVQAVVDQTNFLSAIDKWGDETEEPDDPAPLPVTSEPDESSSNGSLESESTKPILNVSGGLGSESGSVVLAGSLSPTGGSSSGISRTLPLGTLHT